MQLPRVWAEVDLDAIANNLAVARALLKPGVKVLGVVKADAYGHGAAQVAATLERCGIDMLGVGDSNEAIQLRQLGIKTPILVLGGVVEGEIPDLIQHQIMPSVHSPERIAMFESHARRLGVRLPVHLLVDTGMSLLGVTPANAPEYLRRIHEAPHLDLRGMGSHLASATTSVDFSQLQIDRFRAVVDEVKLSGLPLPPLHMASSAGVVLYPEIHYDMVRLGGMLYGIPRVSHSPSALKPALSLHTQIVHIRDIAPGTPVSYDGTFVATRPMRIATLPVGYHDGYLHHLSNRAQVLIHGMRAPVIGRVTMDYVIVDLTDIAGTTVGDRVTLLGEQGDDSITAVELGRWANTIPYEIPSHLGQRVRRIFLRSDDENLPGTARPAIRRYLERIELVLASGAAG
ncbi:MAG: alanine racemase [Planctomycetota bacterium]